jgi:hypothetical protein
VNKGTKGGIFDEEENGFHQLVDCHQRDGYLPIGMSASGS